MSHKNDIHAKADIWIDESLTDRLNRCREMLWVYGILTDDECGEALDRCNELEDRIAGATITLEIDDG